MYKYSFRLPPYYTLLVRSLSVLEGIALASDPNYKVRLRQRHVVNTMLLWLDNLKTAESGARPRLMRLCMPSTDSVDLCCGGHVAVQLRVGACYPRSMLAPATPGPSDINPNRL
jgi:hypothetical protein